MEQELLQELYDIGKTSADNGDEAGFRNRIQDIFNEINLCKSATSDSGAVSDAYFSAQSLLKQFYNCHYASSASVKENVNLTALCKAAAFCCDLISADWNRRIFFLSGGEPVFVSCCERQIVWAVLSVIANAVMYSDSKYIGVSLKSNRNSAIISIENCGKLNYEKLNSAFLSRKSSLFCTKEIAQKHGGTLVCSCFKANDTDNFVKFCISINNYSKKSPFVSASHKNPDSEVSEDFQSSQKHKIKLHNDYISDFLDDKMSPLYTAFCELLF